MSARLYLAQKGLCFHCGNSMKMGSATKLANGKFNMGWTREHVVPLSKGGKNTGNIVLAHIKCNTQRGNADPTPDMLERLKAIHAVAYSMTTKEIQTIMVSREKRARYFNFHPYEGEPKFVPEVGIIQN